MSIGTSGRIVIEVEPAFKRKLYASLALDGLTLKDWFLDSAVKYLENMQVDIQDVKNYKDIDSKCSVIDEKNGY